MFTDVEQIHVQNREQWLALREKDITASVAAALFNAHDYTSELQLFMLKAGHVSDVSEETPPMRRGRLLEPVALQLIQEERPDWKLLPNAGQIYYRSPMHRVGATPDSLWQLPDGRIANVQIKTVEPMIFRMKWLDDTGQIDPPLWIAVQGTVETFLTKADLSFVAPMRVSHGIDIDIIPIPTNIDIMTPLVEKSALFWDRVARQSPPPANYAIDGNFLRKFYDKEGGEPVDLTANNRVIELCEDYELANASKKRIEAQLDAIKAEFVDILGDAPAAIHPEWTITRKTQTRKSYTVKESSTRVLRVARKKLKEEN